MKVRLFYPLTMNAVLALLGFLFTDFFLDFTLGRVVTKHFYSLKPISLFLRQIVD